MDLLLVIQIALVPVPMLCVVLLHVVVTLVVVPVHLAVVKAVV